MPAVAAEPILQMDHVSKSFAGIRAVRDLTLEVRRGTIHALIGPNGAGKTTVFNLVTKFHQPTSGRISFKGRDITFLSPSQISRLGIGRSFQISAVFGSLTALENVRIALQRFRRDNFAFWRSDSVRGVLDEDARALLALVGIEDLADRKASELPYGRRRALELATTLALEPEFLLP
jgi:branched-chain amino acid transport system ATP-binding protein